ncbi:MAG: hypothetical protein EPN26_05885 [Rhodospirillales bacterium]|nr:MAG: hypothetical protein EPN26_05885 [Rhodospirillales bacterium]
MKKIFLSVAALGCLLSAAPLPALAAMDTLDYTVLRDGSPIGRHTVKVERNGARTLVSINSDIEVKVLFVSAYRFVQKSTEEWENGKLVRLVSKTHDDGPDYDLSVATASDGLSVTAAKSVKGKAETAENGGASAAPQTVLPASLWNPETVRQSSLLNTIHGKVMSVTVAEQGKEPVAVKGASIPASHYAIRGELERDLWIDAEGNVVQYQFKDRTGSQISYVLR